MCIGWKRGRVSEHADSRTFNSTKRESHNIRGGGGDRGGGGVDGVGWVRVETRRRCMKAKALQTIVTLYMTSSCYNNTAVIYCTVQVRLNIWLDKADHRRRRHLQYPYTTSVLP